MNQEGNDDMKALDLEKYFKSKGIAEIAEKVEKGTQKTLSLFSSACIYKVPEDLRKLKESAYTPRVIAIGPLHSKDEHIQTPMKDVKLYYTAYLLCRPDVAKGSEVLQKCAEKMMEREEEARKHYAEVTENDAEMWKRMLIDGCFILELLYSHYIKSQPSGGEGSSSGQEQKIIDPILDNILIANIVKHDLLLLENQIPFFVLEELFELTVAQIPEMPEVSLIDYVISYFGNIMSPEDENSGSKKETSFSPGDCV